MPSARARLFDIIREKSFFRGRVVLASGRESDFYFDMKPTMFDPEGVTLLAELILQKIEETGVDYVGGIAVGAIPLITPVSMASFTRGRPIPGFFVRKEVKDHGTRRRIEGVDPARLKGRNVVILEDVTTTGGSAMIAVKAAEEAGARVVMVLSIVDRGEGAADAYARAGVRLESLFTAAEFLAA